MNNLAHKFFILKEKIEGAASASGRSVESIRCVVVTKGQPVAVIEQLYGLGVREIGESRVLDAAEKLAVLPPDVSCHLIGTLQRNKAAHAVGRFSLIHSVDSCALAFRLEMLAERAGVTLPVLIQVNPAEEATKHGFSVPHVEAACEQISCLPHLVLSGLMAMVPHGSAGEDVVERSFDTMQKLMQKLRSSSCHHLPQFRELSMGTSQDFELAIRYGATIVRVGSFLFNQRDF